MTEGSDRRFAVIIEDDADIRNLLEAVLTQAGFETVTASNGLDGIAAVRNHNPVVTTLDVSMPGIDGFEAAKRIRAFSQTYIVMLTARDEEIDTLQGLEAGADDYVTKPFRPRELRARIEAMLRRPRAGQETTQAVHAPHPPVQQMLPEVPRDPAPRAAFVVLESANQAAPAPETGTTVFAATTAPPAQHQPAHAAPAHAAPTAGAPAHEGIDSGWVEHNGLRVNIGMRITDVAGTELILTRSEFDLLAALMDSGRRVRSKADLALLLRGESYVTNYYVSDADKRAVEVHMGNLRRKLGDSITSPRWIETVRGVGYRLAARI